MCLFCPVCLQETFMVIEKLFLSGRESSENKSERTSELCDYKKRKIIFFYNFVFLDLRIYKMYILSKNFYIYSLIIIVMLFSFQLEKKVKSIFFSVVILYEI